MLTPICTMQPIDVSKTIQTITTHTIEIHNTGIAITLNPIHMENDALITPQISSQLVLIPSKPPKDIIHEIRHQLHKHKRGNHKNDSDASLP